MTEESAAALEAAPEAFIEAPAVEQTEGQTDGQAAEGQPEDEAKSKSAERREREKAHRERLKSEAAQARAAEAAALQKVAKLQEELQSLKKPSEKDFPDPLDYTAENAGLSAERRILEREAKMAGEVAQAAKLQAEEIDQRERAARAEVWMAQVAEVKGEYADFEKVALDPTLPVSKAMGDAIQAVDEGPHVLYFLGQNRALAAQIAQLNPAEAGAAIGRLAVQVAQSVPKPRTETNAPPPISPVRGSAGAARDPAKMSVQEYVAWKAAGGKV